MPDLQSLIEEIQKLASSMNPSVNTRRDSAVLKQQLISIQDACAYSFTAIKQINRTLN